MIVVFFCRFAPTLNVITGTADILMVLRYPAKKISGFSFLVPTTFGAQFVFHLYFCQSLPTLQRGLSATADYLLTSVAACSIAPKPDNPVD